jgi:hypothetical protein
MSGYNLFVQWNKDLFDADGLATPANLAISKGTVTGLDTFAGSLGGGNTVIEFSWVDNTGEGDALATDEAYIVVYDVVNNTARGVATGATRADAFYSYTLPDEISGQTQYECYAAFRRADGTKASNTAYFNIND